MLKLLKNKYLLTAGAVLVFGLTIAIGILYAKDRVALNDILNEEEAVNFAYLDAGVSSDDVISYTANHGDIISGIKENTGNGNIAQNNHSDNNNNPSLSIHEENPENTEKKPGENSQKDVNKDKIDDKPKTDDKSGGTGNTGGDAADKPSATKTDDTTKNTPSKKTDKTESNTNTSSDTKRYINVDKAKTIALKQAGLTPAMVTFGKAVLKKDDGKIIYEIEFFTSSHEYEYEIDAYSGAILSQDVDALSPSEQTGKNIEQSSNTPKNEDLEKFKDDDDDKDDDKDDNDDYGQVYEIEFKANGFKYSYDIDANDGTVLKVEKKKLKIKTKITNSSQYIGVASAKSIALNHSGLSSYNVTFTKAKLTTEDGIRVYDVEFRTADTEYDYEINAKTGKIIEFSSEPIDDED